MVVGGRELIDTLWNVNLFEKMEKIFAERGINRYIMECKLNHGSKSYRCFNRINRYIMECKSFYSRTVWV